MRPYGPREVLRQLQNDSDDREQSESEFYYPTGDFTLPADEGKIADFPSLSTINTDDDQKTSEDICEVQMFIERRRPENTKKTTYNINIVKKYCISINETREIEAIPAKELYILVSKFFMNVQKKNGRVYEHSSLGSLLRRCFVGFYSRPPTSALRSMKFLS